MNESPSEIKSSQPDSGSDRPIETSAQDKFNRASIASQIAKGIAARRGRDSFVVALQGAWGCGKSSMKNLVLQELGKPSYPPTTVVEFEPWQLRDTDSLFAAFFAEIALALGREGDSDTAQRLLDYSAKLTFLGSTAKWAGAAANIFIPGAGTIGAKADEITKAVSEILKQGGEASPSTKTSLKSQKAALRKEIQLLNRPILVVIDDIDRLEIEEMMLIFQLVKANADFPNFTYLLLLQRDRVQEALLQKLGTYGRDYLDKIFQLSIDVPLAGAAQRWKLLIDGVGRLLKSWEMEFSNEIYFDLERLWESGLTGMLQHPRDVIRLLNALEFSLGVMQGTAGLEVNLPDFLALETLRLQEGSTYARLPRIKHLLTEDRQNPVRAITYQLGLSHSAVDESEATSQQVQMNAVLEDLSAPRRESSLQLLQFVFPLASWAFAPGLPFHTRATEFGRSADSILASHAHCFDRYFALCVPNNELSETEIKRLLEWSSEPEMFHHYLTLFYFGNRHSLALLELQKRIEQIPRANYETILVAAINLFDEKYGSEGKHEWQITHFLHRFLMELTDIQERSQFFLQLAGKSDGCWLFICWLSAQKRAWEKDSTQITFWLSPAHWLSLEQAIVSRIVHKTHNGQLLKSTETRITFGFWFERDPVSAKKWLNDNLSDPKEVLNAFSAKSRESSTHRITDIQFFPELFDWLDDASDFIKQVQNADHSDWSPVDEWNSRSFLDAAHKWQR